VAASSGGIVMLERMMKYWPLITVGAVAIVSVFNIGYFTIVGVHFIGVMDISNVVYAIGLVFSMMIVPIVFFPDNLLEVLRDVGQSKNARAKIHRFVKFSTFGIAILFTIGLFVHQPYISITGLFALDFVLGCVVFTAYAYMIFIHEGKLSQRVMFAGAAFYVFTIYWVGAAVAYHEAFGTKTLYLVTTKDATYDKVRIARSSSGGFLIAQEKRVIYIPSGEVKSIISIEPVDKNP
jgi:hypothetical protein